MPKKKSITHHKPARISIRRHLVMIFLLIGVTCLVMVRYYHKQQVDGLADLFLLPAGDRILERAERDI